MGGGLADGLARSALHVLVQFAEPLLDDRDSAIG